MVNLQNFSFVKSFWNFEQIPVNLVKNQTTVEYSFNPNGDDAAFGLAGLYFQMPDTTVSIANTFTDTLYCPQEQFFLPYNVSARFRSDNVFSVWLSDTAGKFTNPTVIGTRMSAESGFINCLIPANAVPGNKYVLRVVGSSPLDTTENKDRRIRISTYPLPPQVNAITPVCQGWPMDLFDFSLDTAAQYTWTGPNGFQVGFRNPTVPNMSLNGTGYYVLFKENYSCGYKDSIYIEVIERAAKPVVTTNGPVCSGDTLKLWALSATPGVTYNWLMPGGYVQGMDGDTVMPHATIAEGGTYKVVALLNSCVSEIDSVVVPVYETPSLNAQSNSPVCEKGTIELLGKDTASGAIYTWTGPSGFTNPTQNPLVGLAGFINAGTYTVVAKNQMCSDTDTVNVIIKPLPEVPTATSNTPVCEQSSIALFAKTIANITYSWTGPSGFTSAQQNVSIETATGAKEGAYVVVANLDGCLSADTTYVDINPLPDKPLLTSNSPVYAGEKINLQVANVQAGATYKWTGPGDFYSEETEPVIDTAKGEHKGTYTVMATLDGCTMDARIGVDIKFPDTATHLVIYPNPNKGVFTVDGLLESDQQVLLIIYNALGQEVHNEQLSTADKKIHATISIPATASGCYLLRMKADNRISNYRFVISH
jgi:hypothetical protein